MRKNMLVFFQAYSGPHIQDPVRSRPSFTMVTWPKKLQWRHLDDDDDDAPLQRWKQYPAGEDPPGVCQEPHPGLRTSLSPLPNACGPEGRQWTVVSLSLSYRAKAAKKKKPIIMTKVTVNKSKSVQDIVWCLCIKQSCWWVAQCESEAFILQTFWGCCCCPHFNYTHPHLPSSTQRHLITSTIKAGSWSKRVLTWWSLRECVCVINPPPIKQLVCRPHERMGGQPNVVLWGTPTTLNKSVCVHACVCVCDDDDHNPVWFFFSSLLFSDEWFSSVTHSYP